jgi:hypothetical protein
MPRKETLKQFDGFWEGLENPHNRNASLHNFRELRLISLCCALSCSQSAADIALFAEAKERFLHGLLTLANGLLSRDTFSWLVPQSQLGSVFATCFSGLWHSSPNNRST